MLVYQAYISKSRNHEIYVEIYFCFSNSDFCGLKKIQVLEGALFEIENLNLAATSKKLKCSKNRLTNYKTNLWSANSKHQENEYVSFNDPCITLLRIEISYSKTTSVI